MPEVRPGQVHYTTATKAVNHGAPCSEDGFHGIAIKQVAAPAGTGLGSALITAVAIGEKFIIQFKGRVYLANTTNGQTGGGALSAVKGSGIYITIATNLLTLTGPASGTVGRFGRCTEVAGERGVGAGQIRIDLDARDTLL